MSLGSEEPWYAKLPTPKAAPIEMSVQELYEIFSKGKAGEEFIVVDVRRTDIEEGDGRYIHPAAINLPAQTFYHTLSAVHHILSRVPKVIFHCSSSKGRGPRCAGWYQDYLDGIGQDVSKSYVLVGGIKAWRQAYPDLVIVL